MRREHAIGTPDDCAGLVVFLASNAAAGISGQAIGIGGDRLCLYSHPAEIVTELRDGGWDADAIAADMADALRGARAAVRRPTAEAGHSMKIDVEAVRAIDVHTHAQVPVNGERGSADDRVPRRGGEAFSVGLPAPERAAGRRLLPRALDGGGDLLRRQPARHR